MRICKKALSLSREKNYFLVKTNEVDVRIYFITDEIVRIRAGFDGDFKEYSYSLAVTAWDSITDELLKDYRTKIDCAEALMEDCGGSFRLKGSKLTVEIVKDPYQLIIYAENGKILHKDCVDLALLEDSNHRRVHTSQIEADDCFFGFGEKSGEFNKAQKYMNMSPKDAMGYNPKETDSLYKHIPFYIRLNRRDQSACGYFYHSTAECDFNMGREKSNYWHMHSTYRADNGDIDLFFIAGPSVKDVVKRYTFLTGKSMLLPIGALGYLGSSMYYAELDENCDDAINEFIDTIREENIGVDGFQLSSGYTSQDTEDGLKRCVFTWNHKRFKDPKAFFKSMDEKGVVVSPNVKPGILKVHPKLEEMKARDIFVKNERDDNPAEGTWWGGAGYFVDFTSEQARAYWKKLLKENLLDYGCNSIWNDNCEYDSLVDKDDRCSLEGTGCTIGHIKAAMSNIMCQLAKDEIEKEYKNKRAFVVCRSGHCGIQKYAQTWAGDNLTCWDSLKYNIATILGMSLCGVSNQGCDIGGFYGIAPEEELMVRWVQNGIFQPRFSIHSVNTDNSVTEPWMYSNSKGLIESAMDLRYRLSPYMYSLMYEASVSGLPIMRPMLMEFQHDEKCYDNGIDFMLGEALLVANIVEKGQKKRAVYLPENEIFYDFVSKKRYEGGRTVEVDVTLDTIPMFLRAGGIVAMSQDKLMNLQHDKPKSLEIICSAEKDGHFDLYEDDGVSYDYRRGVYLKTTIDVKSGDLTYINFTKEGSYQSAVRTISLNVIRPDKCPFYVTLDGQKLTHYLHRAKFERAVSGWYYSQTQKSVLIVYPNIEGNYQVKISFEPFDMIGM